MNPEKTITITKDQFQDMAAKAVAKAMDEMIKTEKSHGADGTHAGLSIMLAGAVVITELQTLLFNEEESTNTPNKEEL